MTPFFLAAVILFATFTQSVSGFGIGLVSMAFLVNLVGVQIAVPLVALVALTAEIAIWTRYRHAFQIGSVIRLTVASVIGIPLGIAALERIDEQMIMRILGAVLISYAVYALLRFRLPRLHNPRWAYGFGFVGGILSGLFNSSGPSVVIYGTCRGWLPAEFRSNLQGFFLVNSLTSITVHTLNHNYTPTVLNNYLIALPAIGLGLVAGFLLDRYINAALFRRIVLVLLLILGARLLFGG